MTSLTDKMKKLMRDYDILDDGQFDYRENVEITVHNKAVAQCIALAKAEAAVVGDWEREYRQDRHNDYGLVMSFEERIESEIAFITNLLAAKDRERDKFNEDIDLC